MTTPTTPPPIPSIFDTPEYRRQSMFDALGGMGLSLLRASGPSPYPMDFGSLAGGALAGGVQGMQGSEDRYLKRAMTNMQVAKTRQELQNEESWRTLMGGGGVGPTPQGPPPRAAGSSVTPPPSPASSSASSSGAPGDVIARARRAIGGIETGGGNGYGIVGPVSMVNGRESRPYGQYQVMDFNVGPWTKQILGREMTPQEFLANPQAQDAVFDAKFTEYYNQHGNYQDAASTWFSGRPQAQAGNARDVLGTSVPSYVNKFNAGFGGAPGGVQTASAPTQPTQRLPMPPPPPPAPATAQYPDPPNVAQGDAAPPMPPQQQAQLTGGQITQAPPRVAQGPQPQAPAPAPTGATPSFNPPKTLQEVVATMPPGVRQIIGATGRKDGLPLLLKYADPEAVPALDTQTNQVIFLPKTMVGRDPRFVPVDAAKLAMEAQRLALDTRKSEREERNADVVIGPNGPVPNQPLLDFKKGVSGVQGTDPAGHIQKALADDVIKRNSDWQKNGLLAQSNISRVGTLEALLNQIATNKFKGSTTELKAAAKAAGVDLDALGVKDDVGVTQAAAALTSLMSLENRREMPGPMSDADRSFLVNAAPSITKDPAGNKILIAVKKADLQREIDTAKYAREYISSPAFKEKPEGLDNYINEKIGSKNYYDQSLLNQSVAPAGAIPPPPQGYTVPGSNNAPKPPPGFRILAP